MVEDFEPPIETAEDIFNRGGDLYLPGTPFFSVLWGGSPNPVHRKLLEVKKSLIFRRLDNCGELYYVYSLFLIANNIFWGFI